MSVDLNSRFTFESFITGTSNRLAVTAARSVAEHPGSAHNPLFIYSQTGLGKTHLLMAIGQAALEFNPAISVEYLTLDQFVEAYHAAVSAGGIEDFRQRYRTVGLILIDDVHFLAHRQEEQAELLRFAAELQDAGTQVVLTSDRPPSEIADLDERLISGLAGGLVVDIAAPEYETRLAILNRRAEERGVQLDREVVAVVAAYEVRNVRELLGVLNRLIAFQAVSEHTLTPSAARALLEGGEAAAEEAVAAPASEPGADEFGEFLDGVAATVSEQVEAWKTHLRRTIQVWVGKGYRTARLESMLEQDVAPDADSAVRAFEKAVERLRASQLEIAEFDPAMAENPVFRDPDRVAEAEALVAKTREEFDAPPGPSESFALDDFLMSASTKMAVGAARAVIESPGTHYNPLVIVGTGGTGKTHLLHALGRELVGLTEGRWVACVTAQAFMDELVRAIEEDHVPVWRARYRQASAFLLDNFDLLAGGERVQDEIFYLFNTLAVADRQIVFTSSVAPKEIQGLDERLLSRLEGGLTATLEPPDRDLRWAILQRQLHTRVASVEPAVIDYLADQRAESVRSVLGLGQRVIKAAEAQGVKPTVDLARGVLEASSVRERRVATTSRPSGGGVISPTGGVDSPEKMVRTWPDLMERVIEEMG